MSGDWSELNPELLHLISKKLENFSVSSNTTSRIKLPISHLDFKHSARKATFMGFLLVNKLGFSKPLFLFNPLTETKLYLPFWKGTYTMVYMGPNPNSKSKTIKDGVHLLVHIKDVCDKDIMNSIMFWRSNDDKVTTLRIPFDSRGAPLPGFYKGKIFVYQWERRETIVFDMETGAEMNIVIPNPRGHLMKLDFFVEAIGDLLGVIKFGGDMCSHGKFMVY